MQHIFSPQEILKDLNDHILTNEPWSMVRVGDAGTGIIASMRAPGVVDRGKWRGSRGKKLANSIMGQLTVPTYKRESLLDQVIDSMNESNYMDHYDCFRELASKKGISVLGEKQDEIHRVAGIDNGGMFCNPFTHYFSIVNGEYNLLKMMKNRRIFCITSRVYIAEKLYKISGAKAIDTYRIPRRGRKAGHYKNHFDKVCNLIKRKANKYDFFLISSGLLAVVYCGIVKKHGGRAFDSGRLFDIWGGLRRIDSRPQRFIKYNPSRMLCDRIKKSRISKVW